MSEELPFEGLTVCVTGTLSMTRMTREQAHDHILRMGGRVTNRVNGVTSLLIAGDKPGTKLDAAKTWGIRVMTEQEFSTLVNRTPLSKLVVIPEPMPDHYGSF